MSTESKFLKSLAKHSEMPGKLRLRPPAAQKASGTCRSCGNKHRLRKDGSVTIHKRSRSSTRSCEGSGRYPVSVRIKCVFCNRDLQFHVLNTDALHTWKVEVPMHYEGSSRNRCTGSGLELPYNVAENRIK